MAAILYVNQRADENDENLNVTVTRYLRDRSNPLENISRQQAKEFYRFYPETLLDLCGILFDGLNRKTKRSSALPVLHQVLVAIRFDTCGAYYHVVGSTIQLSKSSVLRCVHAVAKALTQLTPTFVKLPSLTDLNTIKAEFEKRGRCGRWGGIPGVTGAVDGTLIQIERCCQGTHDFICRKGFPAINVQIIAGPNYEIFQSSCRWPGSVGDSRMFRASGVGQAFEGGKALGTLSNLDPEIHK